MYDVVIGFAIGGIGFSLLAIFIRVIDRRLRGDFAEILLSIALFSLMWFVFIYLMVIARYIPNLPNLYNKGIPLYYLIAPCFYLYVRLKLYPVSKMPAYWLLHALPFIFGLIDIVPYMLVSTAEKQAFLSDLVQNVSLSYEHDFGFIHQQWHYVLKLVLSLIYLLAQWRLLFMADATGHGYTPRLRFTLYAFTLLFSLLTLMQISIVLNMVFNRQQAAYIMVDSEQLIWISGLYLLFSIWLCVGPYLMRLRTYR